MATKLRLLVVGDIVFHPEWERGEVIKVDPAQTCDHPYEVQFHRVNPKTGIANFGYYERSQLWTLGDPAPRPAFNPPVYKEVRVNGHRYVLAD